MGFDSGDWVVDTKRKTAPTVCAVIRDSIPTLYILEDDDGNYYIENEQNLAVYDKYWFK